MSKIIAEHLDALRATLPLARLTAFVDLHSELVLINSASYQPRQEELDRLAASAARALSSANEPSGAANQTEAILLTSDNTMVFVRSPIDQNEALCCVCDPSADANAALDGVHTAMDEIAKTP